MTNLKLSRRSLLIGTAVGAATAAVMSAMPAFAATALRAGASDPAAWWRDARFGLFLHWNLFTVSEGEWKGKPAVGAEHFMLYQKIPLREYATLADRFNPVKFDPDAWVKMALDAGMKYLVITAKHHEGFAIFDSPSSDYDMVDRTPYKRDPLKQLADACHRHGLKLGFYYSLGRDWQDPDVPTNWPVKAGRSNTWDFPNEDGKVFDRYFQRKVKPQITELLTQYGQVDILWFDTPELIPAAASRELRGLIRKLQPDCIVNSRIGNGIGDFGIAEQTLGPPVFQPNGSWEACVTMSKHWGYFRNETDWKSPELLVRQLATLASEGGNYLLNVGPSPLGEFPPQAQERLKAIGAWMRINGDAIYGTTPWSTAGERNGTPFARTAAEDQHFTGKPDQFHAKADGHGGDGAQVGKDAINDATSRDTAPEIRYTAKGKNVFILAMSWHEAKLRAAALRKGAHKVKSLKLLGHDGPLEWKQTAAGLEITLPTGLQRSIPIYAFRVALR